MSYSNNKIILWSREKILLKHASNADFGIISKLYWTIIKKVRFTTLSKRTFLFVIL